MSAVVLPMVILLLQMQNDSHVFARGETRSLLNLCLTLAHFVLETTMSCLESL